MLRTTFAPRVKLDGRTVRYNLCTNRHKLGSKACSNRWTVPYDGVTDTILNHFRDRFLNPIALGDMLQMEWERARVAPEERAAKVEGLRANVSRWTENLPALAKRERLGASFMPWSSL